MKTTSTLESAIEKLKNFIHVKQRLDEQANGNWPTIFSLDELIAMSESLQAKNKTIDWNEYRSDFYDEFNDDVQLGDHITVDISKVFNWFHNRIESEALQEESKPCEHPFGMVQRLYSDTSSGSMLNCIKCGKTL